MTTSASRRGHGEGSIFQRKDGLWVGTLDHGRGPDGRRLRKAFYAKTRKEASEKLRAALAAHDRGIAVDSDRRTMGVYLADWLKSTEGTLRPRTHLRYEQYLRIHAIPFLSNVRLTQLTPQHLRTLYAERMAAGASASSVGHLHAVLHKALSQAADDQIISRNVASLVKKPRAERPEIKTLSPDEARQFVARVADDPLEALYLVAVTTGMRQGEILALRWRDVDLEAGQVQVRSNVQYTQAGGYAFLEPKTASSRRSVMLTKAAVAALRRHRTKQLQQRLAKGTAWRDLDLVFPNDVGEPMRGTALTHRFQALLVRLGLPRIRFHDLRHTAATLLLGRGVHPKIVSEMLGHATVAITLDIYSHVTPTMQREATAALDAILSSS